MQHAETREPADSLKGLVSNTSVPAPAAPAEIKPVLIPDELVPERRGTLAFVSNVERHGEGQVEPALTL